VQKIKTCFVLKRFLPNKNKLSVLTQDSGKIEIITRPINRIEELWPGMLLSCYIEKELTNSKIFTAQNIEIINSPIFNSTFNIDWAHLLLEICYYFLPLHAPEPEIFELLNYALNINLIDYYFFHQELNIIKKIFIVKILTYLGFYPTKNLIYYQAIYLDIIDSYINIIDKNKLKLLQTKLQSIKIEQIKQINYWIISSLGTHQNFRQFKTICSLKNI